MIKRIDTKSGKKISYVYNLKDEDYRIVSERLEMDEDKIKNVIDEETFTPRISKSDWEILWSIFRKKRFSSRISSLNSAYSSTKS